MSLGGLTAMVAAMRMLGLLLLLVLPGGLVILAGVLFARAYAQSRREALAQGADPSLRQILSGVQLRDVLRGARLAR